MMHFARMTSSRRFFSSPMVLLLAFLVNKPVSIDAFTAAPARPLATMAVTPKRPISASPPNPFLLQSSTAAASSMESSVTTTTTPPTSTTTLSKRQSTLVRMGLVSFIVSMCLALPLTLVPQKLLYKLGWIDRVRKERWALLTAQFCARSLLRVIPFMKIKAIPYHNPDPPASVWVCNHASMLDVFVLLAADKKLRGKARRPIKIIYWKQLEDNPISKLLFRQAGFIPVQMAANKPGEDNEYDRASFKQLVKSARLAFKDGFDLGILPEGQLNPHPEQGLLHAFPGAFTLAKMGGRRPIQMMALHGVHELWHPEDGMQCTSRNVGIRVYPAAINFDNAQDFVACFNAVVGHFATYGTDLPASELRSWLSGKSPAAAAAAAAAVQAKVTADDEVKDEATAGTGTASDESNDKAAASTPKQQLAENKKQ